MTAAVADSAARGRAGLGRANTARAARLRHAGTVLAFLSPWLLGVGLFFIYPLVSTIYFSFTTC